MRQPKYSRSQAFERWTLRRFIDAGGNGEVWEAENTSGAAGAIKILHRFGGDRYGRFRREVEILSGLDPDEVAILPLLDSYVPEMPDRRNPPWYVMPLATSIAEALRESPLPVRARAVRDIAATLATLAPQIHHRVT